MRAVLLRKVAPQTRLPTPVVQQAVVQQPVNLKPYGNTVAVTTLAENPFEGGRAISVRTQAIGGMAKPDPRQQSRRLMHDMLPGLGDGVGQTIDAPPTKPAGFLDLFSTAARTGTDLFAAQQQIALAKAQAKLAQAQGRQGLVSRTASNVAAHKGVSVPLIIVGVSALAIAGFFFFKGRK